MSDKTKTRYTGPLSRVHWEKSRPGYILGLAILVGGASLWLKMIWDFLPGPTAEWIWANPLVLLTYSAAMILVVPLTFFAVASPEIVIVTLWCGLKAVVLAIARSLRSGKA